MCMCMCVCFILFYSSMLVFYLMFSEEKEVEVGGGEDLGGDKEWKIVIEYIV